MSGVVRSVRLELGRGDGLGELVLDCPDRPDNVLTGELVDELEATLDTVARAEGIEVLLVRSAKEKCFLVGPDLDDLARVDEVAVALGQAARVQALFARLERLRAPAVAAVRGDCLGSGLELALACRFRLAAEGGSGRFGLDQVHLGVVAGNGGTVRLPRRIGIRPALRMIVDGAAVTAREARLLGLVDALLPADDFAAAAGRLALRLVRGEVRPRRPARAPVDHLLEMVGPARDLYFHRRAARERRRQRRSTVPARALDTVREGLAVGGDEAFDVEAASHAALVVSAECKGLVRVARLGQALAARPGVDLDRGSRATKVALLGAGDTGAAVASWLVRAGVDVRLAEASLDSLGAGCERLLAALGADATTDRLARVAPTTGASGLARAQVAIEAVTDDRERKRQALLALETRADPAATLVTTTCSLAVTELGGVLRRPERLVGLHVPRPPGRMALVEVVRGDASAEEAVATVVLLARRMGRVPLVVGDGPGFLLGRVLAPYLREALELLAEGVEPQQVERAMRDFGMASGPLEQLDLIGLGRAARVGAALGAAYPDRLTTAPVLDRLAADVGPDRPGFCRWRGRHLELDPALGRRLARLGFRPASRQPSRGAIQERLLLALLNEATRALEEGVVRSPGECDLALVLGAGFPAARGGLFAFASTLGVEAVLAGLERLEGERGERFRPAPLITALHDAGKGFLEARQLLG